MNQKIVLKINPNGNIDLGVENGDGKNCLNITKRLEEALQNYSTVDPDKQLVSEYYKDSENFLTEEL